MQQANDRFWQVDDLQPSTAPPSSFAYNPNTVLDLDMTDFRVKEKGFFFHECGRRVRSAQVIIEGEGNTT